MHVGPALQIMAASQLSNDGKAGHAAVCVKSCRFIRVPLLYGGRKDGDFDAAIDYLRKKGQKLANKRADREASEG